MNNRREIMVKYIEIKNMQRLGTEAIRTQIQKKKPEREISKITKSHIQREHYNDQPIAS